MAKYPPLGEVMAHLSPLKDLVDASAKYRALNILLRQKLPADLAAQCTFSCIRGQNLVFVTTSPVWAAKLRLFRQQLLSAAQREHGLSVADVTIRVARN
jgi:hypothetical protein